MKGTLHLIRVCIPSLMLLTPFSAFKVLLLSNAITLTYDLRNNRPLPLTMVTKLFDPEFMVWSLSCLQVFQLSDATTLTFNRENGDQVNKFL